MIEAKVNRLLGDRFSAKLTRVYHDYARIDVRNSFHFVEGTIWVERDGSAFATIKDWYDSPITRTTVCKDEPVTDELVTVEEAVERLADVLAPKRGEPIGELPF